MRTIAILPVKSFAVAKQRLRDRLEGPRVETLVEEMFTTVLRALGSTAVEEILVVTAWPTARRIAEEHGAQVIEDGETGHNDAAALGIASAISAGAERVLLVPGDCPALDPAELEHLLARPIAPPSALIVPDRHRTGTNALLLTPPEALAPSFGPGSCQRHLSTARERGTNAEVIEVPSLLLDIDTPADLECLATRRC